MEIIVFSAKGCIFCDRQKDFMEEKGLKFEEIDVSADEEGFKEFLELGGTGTPLTVVKQNGGVVSKILGFNEKKLIQELLT